MRCVSSIMFNFVGMNKRILRLAIPNIISNITIPLVGMVDLAVLGHLESEKYIGAIAVGGIIFNVLYWGFGFLRMGTSGFTAQAYGERKFNEVMNQLGRSVIVALGGAALLILLTGPIGWISFKLINGSAEVETLAREYYRIRILAAPATLGLYALTGWFIGMQNTRFPMIIAILVNVLNVLFNLYFIYGLGMKSDGVAWGTVVAQYSGAIMGLFLFFRYYRKLLKYWSRKALFQMQALTRFFLVNRDFGTFAAFQETFNKAAATRFGSGWAWLVEQNGRLIVSSTPNQDNPLMDIAEPKGNPILALNVWEHAYYLNYQNRRPDYIKAFWNVVNWDAVAERFGG